MRDERWQKIAIAVASVVVLLLIGVLIFRNDSPPTKLSVGTKRTTTSSSPETTLDEETTTTTSELVAASSTTLAKVTTTTRPRTATTRAAAAPSPTTTAPGIVHAPAPGSYHYVVDSTGGGGPAHSEYTLGITAVADENGVTRRNVSVDNTPNDEQAWGSDAVRSLRQPGQYPCTWTPARTLYLGTLSVGATWSSDSTCTKTNVPYPPESNRDVTQFRVNGRHGANWVIHFTEHYSVTESNGQTTETTSTEGDIEFDAQRGLVVRRLETMKTVDIPEPRTVDTRLA